MKKIILKIVDIWPKLHSVRSSSFYYFNGSTGRNKNKSTKYPKED